MYRSIYIVIGLCLWVVSQTSHGVETREIGNLVLEDIPEIPEQIKNDMRRYQNTRFATLTGWHPDSSGIVISTRFGETSQLHVVEQPKGQRKQITFFDEPVGSSSVSPTKREALISKDVGGSEYFQIFLLDLVSGDYQLVTDGQSRNGSPVWSNDGESFVYYSTRRNERDWDLYLSDRFEPNQPRLILDEGGTWFPIEFSPNDDQLLVQKYVSANESYLSVLNLNTKVLSPVGPSDQKIRYGYATWTADGSGIYATSDEDQEFLKLRLFDLTTGSSSIVTADIPWDIDEITASNEANSIALTSNEDGISRLYLLDQDSGELDPVELPIGLISRMNFSPDGKKLGLVLNSPTSPADVYSLDLATQSLTRWTQSEVGGLNPDNFATPTLIRYPTFDQVGNQTREIPAFYYRPKGKGPFPVLIRIHGGPEGQSRPLFSWTTQYFVNQSKYAVLIPNVRGSTGYGKTYLTLDNGFKREDSVKDIGMLLQWIEEQPELDASKVAVYGGSYGGYMVLASMVNFNDRIACGVDIVGISNFVTFLQNTKDYRRDLRRPEYGDERDPKMREFLNRISPTNNAKNITKPLFVVQGLNDPRVPVTESEQMVREIRENGQDVWYLLAKDEGHGFDKKSNRDFYLNATSLFLSKCL